MRNTLSIPETILRILDHLLRMWTLRTANDCLTDCCNWLEFSALHYLLQAKSFLHSPKNFLGNTPHQEFSTLVRLEVTNYDMTAIIEK